MFITLKVYSTGSLRAVLEQLDFNWNFHKMILRIEGRIPLAVRFQSSWIPAYNFDKSIVRIPFEFKGKTEKGSGRFSFRIRSWPWLSGICNADGPNRPFKRTSILIYHSTHQGFAVRYVCKFVPIYQQYLNWEYREYFPVFKIDNMEKFEKNSCYQFQQLSPHVGKFNIGLPWNKL